MVTYELSACLQQRQVDFISCELPYTPLILLLPPSQIGRQVYDRCTVCFLHTKLHIILPAFLLASNIMVLTSSAEIEPRVTAWVAYAS